tara:strand:+ start:923 stop:1048 length:126 start_codon:yes stop_codon:yes gene_type:complete
MKFSTFYGLLIIGAGIGSLVHWTIGTGFLIVLYIIAMRRMT